MSKLFFKIGWTFLIVLVLLFQACSFTKKVDSGIMAYDLKQYAVAIDFFQEEFQSTKSSEQKAETAFLLGKSYQYVNDDKNALIWFKKSVELKDQTKALRELAFAYKKLENYQQAVAQFEKLQSRLPGNQQISREIGICRQAELLFELDPKYYYDIERLGFNSEYGDYAPVILSNELVFTSDRNASEGDEVYNWTGHRFSDLFKVRLNGGDVMPFDESLNTEFNEGAACFNKDGTEIYFTRCYFENEEDDANCKIMYSYKDEYGWSDPEPLNFILDEYNYGHPCLIENDEVLVFASDRSENGDYNLYYTERLKRRWAKPSLLPAQINSQGNEKFPTSKGDSLFFSSDYLPGLGGYDIFVSVLKDGTWSKPENLKAPINSGGDDYSLQLVSDNSRARQGEFRAYFNSNRNSSTDDDIYFLEKRLKEKEVVVEETPKEEEEDFKLYLALKVLQPIYESEDPNSALISKEPLAKAKISINQGEEVYESGKKGLHIQELMKKSKYQVVVSKDGFLNERLNINTSDIDKSKIEDGSLTISKEVVLKPIIKNREIVLENIYYDFDRWNIREDAQPSLNDLAQLMRENRQLKIQLSSHTDCQGNDAYNLNLSQKRAQSAVDYIISTGGISPQNIFAKGFGETNKVEDCICDECTEEEHQANRRTSFMIID